MKDEDLLTLYETVSMQLNLSINMQTRLEEIESKSDLLTNALNELDSFIDKWIKIQADISDEVHK